MHKKQRRIKIRHKRIIERHKAKHKQELLDKHVVVAPKKKKLWNSQTLPSAENNPIGQAN